VKTVSTNKWQPICRGSSDDALVQILGSSTFPKEAVYAAQAELTRRSEPKPSCTNLYQWRRELAAGMRTAYTFDELWRRACEEVNEMELQAAYRRAAAPPPSTRSSDLPF